MAGLDTTLLASTYSAIRTAAPAANVTVRFGGTTTKTGLRDSLSTNPKATLFGVNPGQSATVFLLISELTSVTYTNGTVIELLQANGSTYTKYRIAGQDVLGGTVVQLACEPEELS